MTKNECVREYEFIDISFDACDNSCRAVDYRTQKSESDSLVREEELFDKDEVYKIVYDVDGIPIGDTIAEIEQREVAISKFFEKWSITHTDRKVFNEILHEYIYVRAVSIIEAKEHSAKRYQSTRAVMIIDEILRNAIPVKRVPKKAGNKNQKDFDHMLVMVYRHSDLGTLKLTVGVRSNAKKIQYGLTALRPEQHLIDEYSKKNMNKRKPKN